MNLHRWKMIKIRKCSQLLLVRTFPICLHRLNLSIVASERKLTPITVSSFLRLRSLLWVRDKEATVSISCFCLYKTYSSNWWAMIKTNSIYSMWKISKSSISLLRSRSFRKPWKEKIPCLTRCHSISLSRWKEVLSSFSETKLRLR